VQICGHLCKIPDLVPKIDAKKKQDTAAALENGLLACRFMFISLRDAKHAFTIQVDLFLL